MALPGVQPLLVFGLMVVAMFVRGTNLPTRGELVEQRLPLAPRAEQLWRHGFHLDDGRSRPPDRAALRLQAGADHVAAGDDHVPLARRDHRLRRPDLGRPARPRRRLGLHRLPPRGGSRHRLSRGDADRRGRSRPCAGSSSRSRALRVRGVSLAVVTLAAAVAIEQFVFLNTTWGGGSSSSPVPEPKIFGLDLGPYASFRGLDGKVPSPVFGFFVARRHARTRLAGREPAPLGPRAADARRPLQRARRGRRRDQRPQRQARRVRNRLLHRRHRRRAVRLQLQLGHGQPLLGADRAQPDRPRLRRRHHDGLGRGVRRPHLGRSTVPVRAREVVRDLGQLGAAVRRRRPDPDAATEPGRRCRRGLQAADEAKRGKPRPSGPDPHPERSSDGQDPDDARRQPRAPARPAGFPRRRGARRVRTTRRPTSSALADAVNDVVRRQARGRNRRHRRRRDGQVHLDHLPLRARQRARAAHGAARGRQHPAAEPRPSGVPGVLRRARRRVRPRGREPGARSRTLDEAASVAAEIEPRGTALVLHRPDRATTPPRSSATSPASRVRSQASRWPTRSSPSSLRRACTGCTTSTTRARRSSSSRSPTPCTRSTGVSSTRASCSRSTTRCCCTSTTRSSRSAARSATTGAGRSCGSRRSTMRSRESRRSACATTSASAAGTARMPSTHRSPTSSTSCSGCGRATT